MPVPSGLFRLGHVPEDRPYRRAGYVVGVTLALPSRLRHCAITALPITALPLGGRPVLAPCDGLYQAKQLRALQSFAQRICKSRDVLDSERQPPGTRFEDAIGVPPPGPDVDRKAAAIIIEGDADEFATVPRPFRNDDRERGIPAVRAHDAAPRM